MAGIKVFECALCKDEVYRGLKGAKRFIGTRKDVRQHLREEHHTNRKAKFYGRMVGHKGNRTRGGKDERSIITRNCILYREY
jgi:hypothetical protein